VTDRGRLPAQVGSERLTPIAIGLFWVSGLRGVSGLVPLRDPTLLSPGYLVAMLESTALSMKLSLHFPAALKGLKNEMVNIGIAGTPPSVATCRCAKNSGFPGTGAIRGRSARRWLRKALVGNEARGVARIPGRYRGEGVSPLAGPRSFRDSARCRCERGCRRWPLCPGRRRLHGCRFLLHGQRHGPARRHTTLRLDVPDVWLDRLSVDLGRSGGGQRPDGSCAATGDA